MPRSRRRAPARRGLDQRLADPSPTAARHDRDCELRCLFVDEAVARQVAGRNSLYQAAPTGEAVVDAMRTVSPGLPTP